MRRSTVVLLCAGLWACGSPSQSDSGAGGGSGGGGEVSCSGGRTRCESICVNLSTSNMNCGFCGKACNATSQCVGGTCLANDCTGSDCADGQVCFGDQCLQRACVGVNCEAGTSCLEGVCVTENCGTFNCPAGRACVAGCCEDVQCSGVNCGTRVCELGRCVAGTGGGGGSMCGLTGGGGGSTGGGGGATGGGGGGATGGGGGATGGGGGGGGGATGGGTGGGGGSATGGGTADAGSDAGTDAGTDAGIPPPVIIFSAAFDGPAIASSPNSQPIYGRISGLTLFNAESCSETITLTADGGFPSRDAGLCGTTPAAWMTLPDGQWSYDNSAQLWRRVIPPPFPPDRYRHFAHNLTTGARATPVVIDITGPIIIFSDTPNGPAKTDFVLNVAFYGRITKLTASNGSVCTEPVTATNCLNFANWSLPTANGWAYDATAGLWRKTFPANTISSGDYKYQARNTQDLSEAPTVVLTITAP